MGAMRGDEAVHRDAEPLANFDLVLALGGLGIDGLARQTNLHAACSGIEDLVGGIFERQGFDEADGVVVQLQNDPAPGADRDHRRISGPFRDPQLDLDASVGGDAEGVRPQSECPVLHDNGGANIGDRLAAADANEPGDSVRRRDLAENLDLTSGAHLAELDRLAIEGMAGFIARRHFDGADRQGGVPVRRAADDAHREGFGLVVVLGGGCGGVIGAIRAGAQPGDEHGAYAADSGHGKDVRRQFFAVHDNLGVKLVADR